ncbi:uncharacterized protein [Maniola hyperantus]|uniref:uncharacterized protein n=1 Tax=Aphantopus hyperantus TaxID=2795564 RepID=UPI00156A463B|nr:uncharacterized protein LOC117994950 [Maniola hyperantus]
MDFKTVAKSKSSNAAISGKAENKTSKKSLSNGQFQPLVVKKRGVYVEKKIRSSTDTQEANDIKIQTKPSRRPRPGQKKFLASVLTILSKSSTGTQYPDIQDSKKEMARFTAQWKNTNDSESKYKHKTKKTKYRSRVLNNNMLQSEKEQLIILQTKKKITQTPSNNSLRVETAIASDITKLTEKNEPKQNTIRDILENNIYSGVAEGITKEVLEVKPKKEKILRINDDPETLASEMAKKDDKNIYNFVVDLLETTMNVYNVKTEYEISDVSKSAFELNDTVIEKLEIQNKHNSSHDIINHTSKCERVCPIKKTNFDVLENVPIDIKSSEYRPFSAIKPKIKVKPFLNPKSNIYTRKVKTAPKSKSFDNNKKYTRKPNKTQILNDLKQEIAKDIYTFNEPKSLYDALKVMAKNKRRNEKSLHFVNNINKRMDYVDSECMFERRKIISFRARKNNQIKKKLPTSESRNNKKAEDFSKKRHVPSSHSLKVFGYDYEDPAKVVEDKREKRIIFNYHSSPSTSESLVDYNTVSGRK